MTTALDLDPYLLPRPTPDSPLVLEHLATPMHAHLNTRYADPVWPLAPLTANPSAMKYKINWSNCPVVFQAEIRLAAWNLINGQLRPTFLRDRATRLRGRISLATIADTVMRWMHLATWLEARQIHRLAECDTNVLHDYGQHLLATQLSRGTHRQILIALTRLWAYDQLSACPAGIGCPPWEQRGADDYLPAATSIGGENTTEPLNEQTMGPLLIWAMRVVDDLSEDILAAWAQRQRLTAVADGNRATPAGLAALHAYLDSLLASKAPIPVSTTTGQTSLARTYICALTGGTMTQIHRYHQLHGIGTIAKQRPGPCPMTVPITGQIAGKPWRTALDFDEAPALMRHLATAAFIVCAYLTGMRPQEVLGLRTGCCPDPKPNDDGTIGRHLIRSHQYKTATDEAGNHLSAGAERDVPWVAIAPVANAIRVLERMVPDGHLLFDRNIHDHYHGRTGTGALKAGGLRTRIEQFISWANNEATTHGLTSQTIPPDPHGKIGTARFRRSLAWHIARRPGGLVALAIQYGHLRTGLRVTNLDLDVPNGYASRSRGGIHELIDIETVRAVADTVADLHDDLETGGGVSGPAARSAIKAAAQAPHFAGTMINHTTARRLLANEDAMIYDNPQAFLLCHYKRDRALCHRDGVRDTPRLDHCDPRCSNVVRTDHYAAELRARADLLDKQAAHAPQPVGDRLRANATRLRDHADAHDHTRITLKNAG